MSTRTISLILTIVIIGGFGAHGVAAADGLLGQMQCPCSCGKYLSVCECGSAEEAREYVKTLADEGKSNDAIASAYGQKYGDEFVEYVPKQGSGLSLWALPALGLIAGAGGIYYLFGDRLDLDADVEDTVCRECGTTIESPTAAYCPGCGITVADQGPPGDPDTPDDPGGEA